jgi:hypothetical protein
MTEITKSYDSAKAANEAAAELKQAGFKDVNVVGAAPSRYGRSNGGGATVTVEAPFGTATRATAILDKHGPSDVASSDVATAPPGTGAKEPESVSAPLSNVVRAPVLTRSSPTSTPAAAAKASADPATGSTSQSGPRTISAWLGIPELISSDTFFSGFPLLIRPKHEATSSTAAASAQDASASGETTSAFARRGPVAVPDSERRATPADQPDTPASQLGKPVLVGNSQGAARRG